MPDHFKGEMTFKLTMRVRGAVTPELVAAEIKDSLINDGYSADAFEIEPIDSKEEDD